MDLLRILFLLFLLLFAFFPLEGNESDTLLIIAVEEFLCVHHDQIYAIERLGEIDPRHPD